MKLKKAMALMMTGALARHPHLTACSSGTDTETHRHRGKHLERLHLGKPEKMVKKP